jgi:NAD(P)-dependent dehydrogenase (short-subunit alcohol dehydrogenase family)
MNEEGAEEVAIEAGAAEQKLPVSVFLTSSASAVAPEFGSEAYDVSKAALNHLMIEFSESESTEDLRTKLADFCAQRTLTRRPILPQDCARAIIWLVSDESAKTTGHVIPVDDGLSEAFLR